MVYVDLLVIEDLLLNYIVLSSTGILLNRITNFKKIFLSSVIGTIPLIFLFLCSSKLEIFLINFLFSIIMSILTYKFNDVIYTFKNIAYMYLISIFLAGSFYLINTNFFPQTNNYILSAFLLLLMSPIITLIYIKSIKNIKINYSNYYRIDIYFKDKPKMTFNAYLDTGNLLRDPYNHKPIILISKKNIDISKEKIIFVPYHTIDNKSLLTCFSPTKIYIDKVGFRKKVLVGLVDEIEIEGADCILNKLLLERI